MAARAAKTTQAPPAEADATQATNGTETLSLFDQLREKATTVKAARVFTDKKALVGVPFIITDWAIVPSESAGLSMRNLRYAEVNYVTETGATGTFRDVSTKGIRAQLLATRNGQYVEGEVYDSPILVPEGIEVRHFTTENADGNAVNATLYALSGHDE